jgi:outer membrane translocation and assembly module TamA
VVLNIEDRIYVWDDLFRLLDIGAVAFVDSGYVWPAASVVRVADLKNSVGLGLRVAPSRSGSNSPVRIDVAFPLSHRSSRTMWSLSILAGQAF